VNGEILIAGRQRCRSERSRIIGLSAAVGLLAFLLYAWTAQRGISWQDSGEYQYKFLTQAYTWDVGSGIARLHPTYILMTRALAFCLPFVSVPYVYALSSGLGMAVALCALALTVYAITQSSHAAWVSVVLLGGSQMAWWLSAMTEVYTWSLAFLMLELVCLCQSLKLQRFRWFLGALFFNGCHFGVHNFALLHLPVYAVLFLTYFRRPVWRWGACAGVWCLGAAPILPLIIQCAVESRNAETVVQSVLFGHYFQQKVFNLDVRNGPLWAANMALSSCSFFNPCWAYVVFGGMALSVKRRAALMKRGGIQAFSLYGSLLALTGIHFVFWVRYIVPDQATFILPTLGLLAVWAGIGAAHVLQARRLFLVSLLTAAGFSVMAPVIFFHVAERYVPPRTRVLPFRDEFAYWAYPWKQNENSAERFVASVASRVYPEKMVVWADTTAVAPLMVAQAMGRLPSTWTWLTYWQNLPDEEIERRLRESPNGGYVLSPIPCYVPSSILKRAKTFEQEGLFYRIVW